MPERASAAVDARGPAGAQGRPRRDTLRRAFAFLFLSLVPAAVALLAFGYDFANRSVLVRPDPAPACFPASGPGGGPLAPQPTPAELLRHAPGTLTPTDFRRLAGLDALPWRGRGERIVLLAWTPAFDRSAFDRFNAAFGLPPAVVRVYGEPQRRYGTDIDESMLGVEWAHVVAPEAELVVVAISPWTDPKRLRSALGSLNPSAIATAVVQPRDAGLAVLRDLPSVWNGLRGLPVFASAGDSGNEAMAPAMFPWVTAVGGTSCLGAPGRPAPHWSDGGWGLADLAYLRPAWQQGNRSVWRATPDVSWLADFPAVAMLTDRGWLPGAGTSLSAPTWAGLWTLADEAHREAMHTPLPPAANQVLYAVAAADPAAFDRGGRWMPRVGLGDPVAARLLSDAAHLAALPAGPAGEGHVTPSWPVFLVAWLVAWSLAGGGRLGAGRGWAVIPALASFDLLVGMLPILRPTVFLRLVLPLPSILLARVAVAAWLARGRGSGRAAERRHRQGPAAEPGIRP